MLQREVVEGNARSSASGARCSARAAVLDPLEHEAELMADAFVTSPRSGRRPARISSAQRGGAEPVADLPQPIIARLHALDGTGVPLSRDERAAFEARFGAELGGVRVHAHGPAAAIAPAIGARAFTIGNHVVFGPGHHRPGTPDGTRLLAHELTHVVQQAGGSGAPRSAAGGLRASTASAIQLSPEPGWWERNVSRRYAALKESAYSSMIEGVRASNRQTLAVMRRMAARLPAGPRAVADQIISIYGEVLGVLDTVVFAVVGIIVGFVEGIVDVVKGLLGLIGGVMDLLVRFFYGFVDGGRAFDERANEILAAFRGMPAGLRRIVSQWLERFGRAPTERQSLMIGELTGQVLAFIATFEVAASKAGQIPRITLAVPVRSGNALALAGVSVDVASPAAAGTMVGTASMMASSGGGGATQQPFPRRTLDGVSLRWLERNKPKGWRTVPTREHQGWIWLDERGVERLRFMRPSGTPTSAKWARQANGYFRWQNEAGQFLDVNGVVVPDTAPNFLELTHIMYEGPL